MKQKKPSSSLKLKSEIKSDINKFKSREYRKRLVKDILVWLLLLFLLLNCAVLIYSKVHSGYPNVAFYVINAVICALSMPLVFKKRTFRLKGIIALIIAVCLTVPLCHKGFFAVNDSAVKKTQPKGTFSGVITDVKRTSLLYSRYEITDRRGNTHYITMQKDKFFVGEEPKITEYNGRLNVPVYVVNDDSE